MRSERDRIVRRSGPQTWLRIALVLFVFAPANAFAQEAPAEIPGLTAEDMFPRGCVDCHVRMPEQGMDVRLSTEMGHWSQEVPADVLAKLKPIVPATVTLTGRHPPLPKAAYNDIPASCTACHEGAQEDVPQMGPMLHVLHLTGGEQNHYLTLFGGECTHCHKLDRGTGTWSIPSGPEQ